MADFGAAVVRFFAKNALLVAARQVGLTRAALEAARDYCETRSTAFGKPIGHFQAVAFNVADRAMDVDAARVLVWRARPPRGTHGRARPDANASAPSLGAGDRVRPRSGHALRRRRAVQLHGGSGFIRDYPVEKYMRDAKQLAVCGMTAEQAGRARRRDRARSADRAGRRLADRRVAELLRVN